MSAYKKLNQQDAYISTYTARKSWVVSGSQYRELGIQNIVGLSGSGHYVPNNSDLAYGGNIANSGSTSFNKRLVFESNHHLYYSQFSDAVLPNSSSYENYLQSSFEVSGSRYLYTRVAIFSLPKEMYGTHIEPNSVSIIPDFINSNNEEDSDLDNYVLNNYATEDGVNSIEAEYNLYIENTEFLFGTSGANCNLADPDYIQNESDYIQETIPNPGEYLDTDEKIKSCNEIVDDGEGRLYFKYSIPRVYVGNVIYPHGQIIITDETVAMYYNHYFDAILGWKSNLPIYTHNYHCRIKNGEFNHTLNKTALQTTDGQISDLVSGSSFQPYITTVGLYNDANELVAVGKLGQPLPKSAETDMVVITKLDMNFGVNRLPGGRITTPAPVCTHYFTFRNFVQVTGVGINSNGNPNSGQPRFTNDDGTYQLYLKRDNGDYIERDTDGVQNTYHLIKEVRGNDSHYRSRCYVDVIATGNTTVGFDYQVIYGVRTSERNRRSERFFINILEQYLYENTLSCNYTYETPIAGTLPYSLREESSA